MTVQELVKLIENVPYDGHPIIAAKENFIKMFPIESLPNLTPEQYQLVGSKQSFCYNLEFVSALPFRLGRGPKDKFGDASDSKYPKVGNIVKMINAAESGQAKRLQKDFGLGDIWPVVLLKILSIYLPQKFIGVSNRQTLTLLANILGINKIPEDIIELNYVCTDALMKVEPKFAEYEFYRLGNAIWNLLSPQNRDGFESWLRDNKTAKSGAPGSYVRCIERLSYFYGVNYFHPEVSANDLEELLKNVLIHQKEKNGTYYYEKPSYGNQNYYSAAVNDYMKFMVHGVVSAPVSASTSEGAAQLEMKNNYSKNTILYGPPGTGKTYNTVRYAVSIIDGLDVEQFNLSDEFTDNSGNIVDVKASFNKYVDSGRICFTTFHQSLSYEDFVEGIKPISSQDKANVLYEVKPGIFKQICQKANNDINQNYVLIIDEINRGNVAGIFGELITLIESDKRKGPNQISCKLPYSNEDFSVPSNLYIIGTMNTADRSVEALDSALRRRFDFVEMMPNPDKVDDVAKPYFESINKRLRILKDAEHQLGHSYFMNIQSMADLLDVFRLLVMR